MSLQRPRPTVDALQRIMTSFKQFERKLDKLQDDVNSHGHTLNDLRSFVVNLSASTITNPDAKQVDIKRVVKKTTAIQYDHPLEEPVPKTRRKAAIQPFPTKMKARSFQSPGNIRSSEKPFHTKLSASPTQSPVKYSHKTLRPCKTEAARKASTVRSGKNLAKKRSKVPPKALLPPRMQ